MESRDFLESQNFGYEVSYDREKKPKKFSKKEDDDEENEEDKLSDTEIDIPEEKQVSKTEKLDEVFGFSRLVLAPGNERLGWLINMRPVFFVSFLKQFRLLSKIQKL